MFLSGLQTAKIGKNRQSDAINGVKCAFFCENEDFNYLCTGKNNQHNHFYG